MVTRKQGSMRYNCKDRKSCYLTDAHQKIEDFSDCFPDNISLGDIDGVNERNGQVLFIEFKPTRESKTIGQWLTYRALWRKDTQVVAVVYGNAVRHEYTALEVYYGAKDERDPNGDPLEQYDHVFKFKGASTEKCADRFCRRTTSEQSAQLEATGIDGGHSISYDLVWGFIRDWFRMADQGKSAVQAAKGACSEPMLAFPRD